MELRCTLDATEMQSFSIMQMYIRFNLDRQSRFLSLLTWLVGCVGGWFGGWEIGEYCKTELKSETEVEVGVELGIFDKIGKYTKIFDNI